jgi:hypothetical protein
MVTLQNYSERIFSKLLTIVLIGEHAEIALLIKVAGQCRLLLHIFEISSLLDATLSFW